MGPPPTDDSLSVLSSLPVRVVGPRNDSLFLASSPRVSTPV